MESRIFRNPEDRCGLFTLIVFLSCGCQCSVSLPCDAMCWSPVVCDCGFPGHTHLLLNLYAKLPSVVAVHLCVCEQPRIWDDSLAIVASI